MKYYATRSNEVVNAPDAILNSFDSDGGLYFFNNVPKLEINSLLNKSYQDVAYEVLKEYFDCFSEQDLKAAIDKAYSKNNFIDKILDIKHLNDYSYLELFHGKTLAFKDMALSLYPHLINLAKKQLNIYEKLYILAATSGDTGKAALEAVKDLNDINIAVLYPNQGVSITQKEQMRKQQGNNVEVLAIDGNFDDAQSCVKSIFNSSQANENFKKIGYHLISANSINIARLLPQIVYYAYSYVKIVESKQIKMNEKIDVYVPTGNFGNILAGFLAKKMGVPIDKLVCVSNENNVLYDFFNTGVYDISNRELEKTYSYSMDILISSNLERYLYFKLGNQRTKELMKDLKENKIFKVSNEELELLQSDIIVSYGDNQDILDTIKKEYQENKYLIDPHTALARKSYNSKNHALIVATASPFKFVDVVKLAFENSEYKQEINEYLLNNKPLQIKELENLDIRFNKVVNAFEVEDYLLTQAADFNKNSFEVIVPATTANIGAGFDTSGIALSLYNKFTFIKNDNLDIISNYDGYNDEDNMVYQTFVEIMKKYNKKIDDSFKLKIEGDVPISRGLGSSSTCIIAGVAAANIIGKLNLSKEDIAYEGSIIEGHPDNIIPAVLGGMVSGVIANEKIFYQRISVSKKLGFYAMISQQLLSTSLARAALPPHVEYFDAIFNISRASIALNAFEKVIVSHLPIVCDDCIHQEYRMALIDNIDDVRKIIDSNKFITYWISGAGTTMMFLGHKDNENEINLYNETEKLNLLKLEVDYKGMQINYK